MIGSCGFAAAAVVVVVVVVVLLLLLSLLVLSLLLMGTLYIISIYPSVCCLVFHLVYVFGLPSNLWRRRVISCHPCYLRPLSCRHGEVQLLILINESLYSGVRRALYGEPVCRVVVRVWRRGAMKTRLRSWEALIVFVSAAAWCLALVCVTLLLRFWNNNRAADSRVASTLVTGWLPRDILFTAVKRVRVSFEQIVPFFF